MFGVQRTDVRTPPRLLHFDASANQLVPLAELTGVDLVTPVSTTSDGQAFVLARRFVSQVARTFLVWPNAGSPTGVNELLLTDLVYPSDRLVEGVGGVLISRRST